MAISTQPNADSFLMWAANVGSVKIPVYGVTLKDMLLESTPQVVATIRVSTGGLVVVSVFV